VFIKAVEHFFCMCTPGFLFFHFITHPLNLFIFLLMCPHSCHDPPSYTPQFLLRTHAPHLFLIHISSVPFSANHLHLCFFFDDGTGGVGDTLQGEDAQSGMACDSLLDSNNANSMKQSHKPQLGLNFPFSLPHKAGRMGKRGEGVCLKILPTISRNLRC